MTTPTMPPMPTTPTHGVSPRPRRSASADVDRWLPDPSWPVPPRGWQLWAAAGAPTRTLRAERPSGGDGDGGGDVGAASGGGDHGRDVEPPIVHTVPVPSDMSASAVLEEPSFTLPARPGLLVPEPVDLLADPEPRRVPEGTVSGFAVIGALVAFSCLVGGLTGGFVVIGVSTLLAAIAALVRGRVSLSSVGGQRGAALLLGAAVTALIVPSVTAHQRSAAPESAEGVPVSSPFAVGTQTAYAAVPRSGDPAVPSVDKPAVEKPAVEKPAVVRPAAVPAPPVQAPPVVPSGTASGLTLALDALDPKPANASAEANADAGKGASNGKASEKASDKASEKASKAADKATRKAAAKAAAKAAKASEKAAKAALAEAAKAAEEAAAQARQARALSQQATQSSASTTRSLLGTAKRAEARTKTKAIATSTVKASKAAPTWGVSAKSAR